MKRILFRIKHCIHVSWVSFSLEPFLRPWPWCFGSLQASCFLGCSSTGLVWSSQFPRCVSGRALTGVVLPSSLCIPLTRTWLDLTCYVHFDHVSKMLSTVNGLVFPLFIYLPTHLPRHGFTSFGGLKPTVASSNRSIFLACSPYAQSTSLLSGTRRCSKLTIPPPSPWKSDIVPRSPLSF